MSAPRQWDVCSPKTEPLGWGRIAGRDARQRVRGGEWGLVGVKKPEEQAEQEPGCLRATACAPWMAQCPR